MAFSILGTKLKITHKGGKVFFFFQYFQVNLPTDWCNMALQENSLTIIRTKTCSFILQNQLSPKFLLYCLQIHIVNVNIIYSPTEKNFSRERGELTVIA